jgi:hypothetical protein
MKFYRENWYYVGGVLFIALAFFLGFFGADIDPLRKILILHFMAMMVHQFEEYALPGGFPAIWNIAVSGEKDSPNRYPLNKQSSLFVNTFSMYTVYIVAIIFTGWYWLGITIMMLGFGQFFAHGVKVNRVLKSFYSPGLGAVIFLFIPIGIYYLWYLQANVQMNLWHWCAGILCTPIAAFMVVQLPYLIFKDKESPYPWSQAEMERYSVNEKLAKISK